MSEPRRFLTKAEVAEIYGIHPATVHTWITQGRLRVHRVGPRMIRLDRQHVYDVLGRPSDEPKPTGKRGKRA